MWCCSNKYIITSKTTKKLEKIRKKKKKKDYLLFHGIVQQKLPNNEKVRLG